MLNLLAKSFYYNLSKNFSFLPLLMPINITTSITFKCNSRCKTCNVWRREVNEFTLEEFDKTFKNIGKGPYWFTLSGGEPFLRKDITEICESIYKNCHPKIINIPTNGILYDIIPQKVKEICESVPHCKIVINLSIDGVGEKHDQIRGVKGNYEKAMRVYAALKNLNMPNLTVGIMTVISKYNMGDLPEIWEEVKKLNPDSYVTEIAEEREELLNLNSGITPSPEEYKKAAEFLKEKIISHNFKGFSKIIQGFRLNYYELTEKILEEKKQVIPCMAGLASAHIAPDGDVWFCCIQAKAIGNLREENYNLKKIWQNKKAALLRKEIKNGLCYCPMANASYTNILCNIKKLFQVAIYLLRRQ